MPSPTIVQQVSGSSAAAAPASFTLSGIAATQKGTTLILHAAAAMSAGGSISTPVGWTLSANNPVNGVVERGATFILNPANNAGGITSVQIATLTNVNGIACAFFEVANLPLNVGFDLQSSNNATSTNVSSASLTLDIGGQFWCGYEADVTGQAFTLSQTSAPPNGAWVAGTSATSTNGATNIIIRPFSCIAPALVGTAGATVALTGTLAGAIAWIAGMYSLFSLSTQFFGTAPGGILVSQGAGYSTGN